MMGININDCTQDFTGQILRGEKTIETRSTRSLDPYIGERVGLVRTGVGKATLVGYATVGEPVVYDSVSKFRRDYDKHLVAPGSAFDMKDRLKYGYPLMQVEETEPREIESRGIVARRVNPATPEDFPDVSSAKMRATPQTKTDAFKRWFDGSIVINPDGSPRVMYHGSGFTDLREFKSKRALGQIAGHFAFDPEFAETFAMIYGPDEYNADEEDERGVKKYPSVYPVYLSLKKVFDVRKKEDRDAVGFKEIAKGKGWDWFQLEEPSLVKKMMALGFDGYIDFEAGSNYPPNGIAVFNPRSVKSATGNRGTFDPADPDIRNPKRKLKRGLKRNPATPEDLPPAQGAKAKSPQIDTPAFKRWFNGSVVVTQSGKPRIMYHGTGFTKLTEFRSFRSVSQIAGHFAFDPKFAQDFAMQYATSTDNDDELDDEEKRYPTIYPVYLSLKKLFDIRKKEDRDAVEFDEIAVRQGWEQDPDGWGWMTLENSTLVRRMRNEGFDGFIDFEKGSKLGPTGIAAFDPRSIKSAIGNRGTFDPADPDIRNPVTPTIRNKLSRIIESDDRILCYDTAADEDFYRLWDIIHTDLTLNKESLREIEGMLDDDGVLVIESGETPAGMQDHFRKATRYQGLLLVQGPLNPEQARIETEKLRRDLE
jgi:hypothetical protein